MTEESYFDFQRGEEIFFIFFEASRPILDPTQIPIQRVKGLFHWQ